MAVGSRAWRRKKLTLGVSRNFWAPFATLTPSNCSSVERFDFSIALTHERKSRRGRLDRYRSRAQLPQRPVRILLALSSLDRPDRLLGIRGCSPPQHTRIAKR